MEKTIFEKLGGRLNAYFADIDRQAQERFEKLIVSISHIWLIPKTASKPKDGCFKKKETEEFYNE